MELTNLEGICPINISTIHEWRLYMDVIIYSGEWNVRQTMSYHWQFIILLFPNIHCLSQWENYISSHS